MPPDALRARDYALAEVDAFLSASPVGFALLDRDLRYRRINPVLARLYNRGADEIVGQLLEEVLPPEFEAQIAPLMRCVLRTGATLLDRMVVSVSCPPVPEGRSIVSRPSCPCLPRTAPPAPWASSRRTSRGWQDGTRMKEVEESLREEAVFRERFIGVLAHDLRSPLNAIALSAGALLRQGDAPPAWARTVGRIAHAADRMERMIGNLLDLVRSREGAGSRSPPEPH